MSDNLNQKVQNIRILKVLITVFLSVSVLTYYFSSGTVLSQWIIMSLVGAGVYHLAEKVLTNWYTEADVNSIDSNNLYNAMYSELYANGLIPCLLVSTDDLTVLEQNKLATHSLKTPENDAPWQLSEMWNDSPENFPKQWLDKIANNPVYSSFVCKVKIKQVHGVYTDKLCTLVFIPLPSPSGDKGLLRISTKSVLLKAKQPSNQMEGRLDITRHANGMAYWELDVVTRELFFCNVVSNLLGIDEKFTSPIKLDELQQRADTAIFNFILKNVKLGFRTNPLQTQKMIIDRSGNQHFVYVNAQYFESEGVVVGNFFDITAIKQLEIKLRQQEHQTNQLVDSIPEGIMVLKKNQVVYLNRAAQKLFEVDFGEDNSSMLLADFVSDHDKTLIRDRIRYMLSGKKNSYGFTSFTLRKSDGEYFDAEVAVNLIIYEGEESVQFVIRDLTDVLRVKNALARANHRLSALSSKTLHLIEAERKQIAGELHDDVGQSLTAVLLATKWISRRVDDESILSKISDIHQITSQSLDTVRNLSLLLRPAQLDSLGFSPAIKWQMDKLFSIDDIQYEIDDSHFNEIQDKQAEIVGFRIVQESLTNIVKHARAKNVKVTLFSDENILIIQVSDNGVGFNVHEQSDSVGLINMKERVELAGGEFKIFSKPLLGTDIKVEIPLRNSDASLDSF